MGIGIGATCAREKAARPGNASSRCPGCHGIVVRYLLRPAENSGVLMEQLSLGLCGTSRKENEHRLPSTRCIWTGSNRACERGSSSSAVTASGSA